MAAGQPFLKTFGGKPKPVAVSGRDRLTVSSSCGLYVALDHSPSGLAVDVPRTSLWETQWGQLDHRLESRVAQLRVPRRLTLEYGVLLPKRLQ